MDYIENMRLVLYCFLLFFPAYSLSADNNNLPKRQREHIKRVVDESRKKGLERVHEEMKRLVEKAKSDCEKSSGCFLTSTLVNDLERDYGFRKISPQQPLLNHCLEDGENFSVQSNRNRSTVALSCTKGCFLTHEIPNNGTSFVVAETYIQDNPCRYHLDVLKISDYSPSFYGICTYTNPDTGKDHDALAEIRRNNTNPSVEIMQLREDERGGIDFLKNILQISPSVFVSILAPREPSSTFKLFVYNRANQTSAEVPFSQVTLSANRLDSRGRPVSSLNPHSATSLVFRPQNRTLYVATRNSVYENGSFHSTYSQPGTILTFRLDSEGTLVQQSQTLETSQFDPAFMILAGPQKDKLVVFNVNERGTTPPAIDIYNLRSNTLAKTISFDRLRSDLELKVDFPPLLAASPDGSKVVFTSHTLNGALSRNTFVHLIDMGTLSVQSFEPPLEDTFAIPRTFGARAMLSRNLQLDDRGNLYLMDQEFGFSMAFELDVEHHTIILRRTISHDNDCFSIGENGQPDFGGPRCPTYPDGPSIITDGYLYSSIQNRLTRFPAVSCRNPFRYSVVPGLIDKIKDFLKRPWKSPSFE